MSPNEQLFKKEYAVELLRIAANDLVSAEVLAGSSQVRRETILFNVEQAVEKSLKAILCHRGLPVPFTHDLYAIIQRFEPGPLPPGGYALHDLTPFASIRRYEEGQAILSEIDIQNAIQSARKVLHWAHEAVSP